MIHNGVKISICGVLAFLSSYFEKMIIPIIVLFVVMLFDFITGIIKGVYQNNLSSKKCHEGICKKCCNIILVVTGFLLDIIIYNIITFTEIEIKFSIFFGLLVVFYITINELLSIIENLITINPNNVPKFLRVALEKIKNIIDERGNIDVK